MRTAFARLLPLVVILLGLGLITAPVAQAAGETATFAKVSDWGTGWEGRYTIRNGGTVTISSWRVEFDLPAGTAIGTHWDAVRGGSGNHYVFSNAGWNGTLAPGASVSFGFNGSGPGAPANCTVNGVACGGGGGGPQPPGVPGVPGGVRVSATTGSSISLAWNASSGTVTGYRVYEGTTVRATPTGTSATITGLAACTSRTYTVSAVNAAGESARSAPVTGTTTGCPIGPLPRHFLTGYWHNFVNPAVELRLRDVPADYDLVAVAFAEATGTPGAVTFGVDAGLSGALGGYTNADFTADVATLHARGKKVILSVGGEAGRVAVGDAAAATNFANTMRSLITQFGFDGVDIDLENGLNPTFMGQALRSLRNQVGSGLIITMAPQTIDMQSTGGSYFQLALNIRDILTVVHTQFYNSGSMLGCDQAQAYTQGTVNFMTALACIQLENGLRPDQVALGLPAGPGAAGGGIVAPSMVNNALDCLARGTNCGSFRPPRTYPGIRGAMTWSVNWDVSNGNNFARTVRPFLNTLP
ncbi:MAG TPA: cellulose binding domain-containing protein [Actinophytocola sp.]|uniref:chitinase n=1 Tax=Actinophytocola sp. TaxID=1872138 RepID=UPI002DBCF203|nr:cellulose binding domain-containing protein [Actinophytocola sp.]HEU5470545.1 cellulose binding domain-containing protein [Actinophytocola sp.]